MALAPWAVSAWQPNSLVITRTATNPLPTWGEVRSEDGFPGGTLVKNPPANAGDVRDAGVILGSGRSPGVGNGTPLQYSCLKNHMDRGAWRTIVHGAAKSQMWLSRCLCAHTHRSEDYQGDALDRFSMIMRRKQSGLFFFFPVWTGNRIVTKFQFLHCANPILNDKGLCQIVLDLAQYLTLEQLSRRLDCSWGENALWTWFLNRIRWIPLFSAFKSNTACGCMKAVPDNFAAICLYHSLRKCLDFSNEMLLSLEKDWRETK